MSWILILAVACGTPEPAVAPVPTPDAAPAEAPAPVASESKRWAFPVQEGWTEEAVKSKMRMAQFALPKAEGDPEDASVIVYFFGEGGGGSIDANFQRWAGQFVVEGEADPMKAAKFARVERDGAVLHNMKISGKFIAETRPGSGDRVDKDAWRMLATIVETDGGPYFVKLTGPEKTVQKWASSYDAFLAAAGPS